MKLYINGRPVHGADNICSKRRVVRSWNDLAIYYMSYMVHLTKADCWTKSKENPINMEEVKSLVKKNRSFEIRDGMTMKNPQNGSTINVPGTYIVWKRKEYDIWYRYSGTEISCNYLEDGRVEKLKEIGKIIKAKVFGDEGEEY